MDNKIVKIKKILVSQPKPTDSKSPYFDIAEKYNVKIDFRPFIKVEGISATEFRKQRVNILDYSAVIFTARTAIDHFFRLCEELHIKVPETMKYVCISESVALYMQKYILLRKRKVFHGKNGKLDGLVAALLKHREEKYLLSTSADVLNDELMALMEKNKLHYDKASMYRTVSNDFAPDEPFDYDVLVFFSPAGITSLQKNFPDFEQGDIKIGTLGATTAKAVKDAGLRLDFDAPRPDAPSITAALEIVVKENHKALSKR
jgi:uroporphyrinogen-III synthase